MPDKPKKQKKNDSGSGNNQRRNKKKTKRGRPKPRPKDIFDMDPQSKPKKQKNSEGFDDIISAEYLQRLELSARQAGYNITGARAYFDGDTREHPEEDFRQCAAEWYDDVKYTYGFDVGWFDMQRRWA